MSTKKIIRVFSNRTSFTPVDDLVFIGDPPLIRPEADEVHISVAFTWELTKGVNLYRAWSQYYPTVKIGGPVFRDSIGVCVPGLYVKPGVVFTSRGCNKQCPFCLVPRLEGKLKPIPFYPGNIIQDNNLLQNNKSHLDLVFQMLKTQRSIVFSGGIDITLLTSEIADQLKSLHIKEIFLSCDSKEMIKPLKRAVSLLEGLGCRRLRCYALLGFNGESISDATERLETIWELGCMPFAQLFQPPTHFIKYPREWRVLNRTWSRPAAIAAIHKG